MTYKVMGICAGRKNGNSEILLKEALMACEDAGADVTMINLMDYHILHCIGCTACTKAMSQGKYVGCVLDEKDDKKKIMNELLKQDAVIISVPTYFFNPASKYIAFAQRNLAYETGFLETMGIIEHKSRIAGLISVGGATRFWQSMALEGLAVTTLPLGLTVIDMILGRQVAGIGQCLLHDELIERAHKMGENIMKSLQTVPEERTWLGDDDMGWCPNCHSNALTIGEPHWDGVCYPVECQVCGAGGILEQDNNHHWKFVIREDGLLRDRRTIACRANHLEEIAVTQGGFYSNPEEQAIVRERLVKYQSKAFKSL